MAETTIEWTSGTRADQCGESNPNWRGGRVVASNGYVLVRVGTGHHLADVRGYAYEHRLVAEEMLGRRLAEGEEVHHKDENKQNNSPDNLQVKATRAEHRVSHRKSGRKLRMPDEINPEVECACGCGERFANYDDNGRPRLFVTGHNTDKTAQDAVMGCLSLTPCRLKAVVSQSGLSKTAAYNALRRLVDNGIVEKRGFGMYARKSHG